MSRSLVPTSASYNQSQQELESQEAGEETPPGPGWPAADTCLEPRCHSWLLRAWHNPNSAIHRISRGSPLPRLSPRPPCPDLPGKSNTELAITSCFLFPASHLYFQRNQTQSHRAVNGGCFLLLEEALHRATHSPSSP